MSDIPPPKHPTANAGQMGSTFRAGTHPALAPELLRHELQTQLNACLLRLDYDISRRLGQHTLQKLANNGFNLPVRSRELLQNLLAQLHQALGIPGPIVSVVSMDNQGTQVGHPGREPRSESCTLPFQTAQTRWQWYSSGYRNPDRPHYVEDGYIYLHLAEHHIWGHLLLQKQIYRSALTLLADHLLWYVEKVYYRMEQHWLEFQSRYMNPDYNEGFEPDPHPARETEPAVSSHATHEADITADQVSQHHSRILQLRDIAANFWQHNFVRALDHLQLDWPDWLEPGSYPSVPGSDGTLLDSEDSIGAGSIPAGQQVPFTNSYIPLFAELEQQCQLGRQWEDLLLRLRQALEQSLAAEGLSLQMEKPDSALDSEALSGACYSEYPEWQSPSVANSDFQPDAPDELARLTLRHAPTQWLYQQKNLREQQFIAISEQIQQFFTEVEKSTRFGYFARCYYRAYHWYTRAFPPHRQSGGVEFQTGAKQFGITSNAYFARPEERLPQAGAQGSERQGDMAPPADSFISESNLHYEAGLLLELLQKAHIVLQYQLQFRSNGRHYRLFREMLLLRRQLLDLCHQPSYGADVGIQITAQYRTVHKRRETYRRLESVLQNFTVNCEIV